MPTSALALLFCMAICRRTVTADYYSNVYDNINGTTTLQPQGQSTDAPDKGGDQEGGGGGGVAEEGPRPTVPSPCDTFTGGGCGCVFDMPLTFEPTGWCWSYEKFPTGADGAWCYTQVLGETGPNKNWQRCSKNADCDARMTCGSASRYTGTGERTAEDQLTPAQIANRPTVPTPCTGNCGCLNGWCWSYDKFPPQIGAKWCWTQALGESNPNKNWQRCMETADCDERMTCGSSSRYTGSTTIRSAEDQLTDVVRENRPTTPTPCSTFLIKNEPQCGCSLGWCWAYDVIPSKKRDLWCWAQALGADKESKKWQRCESDADCDARMRCASSSRYDTYFPGSLPRSDQDVLPDSILTPMERIVDPGVDAAGIAVPFSLADPKMKQMIVDVTNEIRRLVKGANLLEVEYDDNLALAAQAWVDTCKGGHGFIPGIGQNGIKTGPEITCFGQNIARGNQGFKGALLSWASEKKAFVYGQKPQCPLQETGHYAVQVYAEVAIMGCGFTDKCSGVRTFICHHCLYSTDYIPGTCSPYLEGTPANGGVCGQCGGLGSNRCPNGLCKVECPLPGADPAQRQACNKFFWENPGVCENGIAKSKKPECKESCDCLQ